MRNLIMIIAVFSCTGLYAQDGNKPPSNAQVNAQMKQASADAIKQREDIRKKIAEAKARNDDPGTIKQLEAQLAMLDKMVGMLGKTDMIGQKTVTIIPAKTEPAFVSPFKEITGIAKPVSIPTETQATDKLFWYHGKKLNNTTLVTTTGLVFRYDQQNNMLIMDPPKRDSIYLGMVHTVGQTRQFKAVYANQMSSIINNFFMYPQVKEGYDEFDMMENRYYELAKNTINLPRTPHMGNLDDLIKQLDAYIDNLPKTWSLVLPPKRPNDLCLCEVPETMVDYQKELGDWLDNFFKEEIEVASQVHDIERYIEDLKLDNKPVPQFDDYKYLEWVLSSAVYKLEKLLAEYQTGGQNVLFEDGLVFAKAWFDRWVSLTDLAGISRFRSILPKADNLLKNIKVAVFSNEFEDYISDQKILEHFNSVFDYGLYLSHEYNKKILSPAYDLNSNFENWIEQLKKYNRFKLHIKLDFVYQVIKKQPGKPDSIHMTASGNMESPDLTVSLARHNCNWQLYITDVNYENINTNEEKYKIPMNITAGTKDYLDDEYPGFHYTGPTEIKMIFPTFNINFCGNNSTVAVQNLSFPEDELKRHAHDNFARMYTTDFLEYTNEIFLSSKRTEADVRDLIGFTDDAFEMGNGTWHSTGSQALDKLGMRFSGAEKKWQAQYRLLQITHNGTSEITLTKPPNAQRRTMFDTTVEMADPNSPDKLYGLSLVHGGISISISHL